MVVLVVEMVVQGLIVVGNTLRTFVVVGAGVVVVVVLVVEEVVSLDVFFVFLSLLRFLVFCVFDVSFSALRFHHFLLYRTHAICKRNIKWKYIYIKMK